MSNLRDHPALILLGGCVLGVIVLWLLGSAGPRFVHPVGSCVFFDFNGRRVVEIVQHYHGNGEGYVSDPTRYVYIFRDDPPVKGHKGFRWVSGPFLGEQQSNQWRQFNMLVTPVECPAQLDPTQGWFYVFVFQMWGDDGSLPPAPGYPPGRRDIIGPFRDQELCEARFRSVSPPWGRKLSCYYSAGLSRYDP